MRLHHVQLSMPAAREDEARRFYVDALGLSEVDKPASLAGRGGCWFRAYEGDAVTMEVHLGVDSSFVPAKKAHPAIVVDSADQLQELGDRVAAAGFEVSWQERTTFEGYERFHCRDGFGNRIEIMTPLRSA